MRPPAACSVVLFVTNTDNTVRNAIMPTEEGRVIRAEDKTAWIQTIRSASCEGCQSRHACHTMGGGGNEMSVEAINHLGAREGDQVVVEFSTASLMKGTFLIYMLPIICLMIGAAVGVKLTPFFDVNESTLPALMGFGSFILAVLSVVFIGNRMGKNDAYKPKIIRIKKPLHPVNEADFQ